MGRGARTACASRKRALPQLMAKCKGTVFVHGMLTATPTTHRATRRAQTPLAFRQDVERESRVLPRALCHRARTLMRMIDA